MTENKKPVDNRSATQKIADLENAAMSLYQAVDNMARDITTLKEAIKLLGNKVDSIVKATSRGEALTDEVLSRIMVENNVEELSQKVKVMVAQGVLAPQEQVGEDSFVVGSELNENNEVVNPRLQFALFALQPEIREKIKGSKPGDVLTLQEGKLKFKVLETFQIQEPNAPESAEVAADAAEAAAEAAPTSDTPAPAQEQTAAVQA